MSGGLNRKAWQITTSERNRLTSVAQINADRSGEDYVLFFDTSGSVRLEPGSIAPKKTDLIEVIHPTKGTT